MSEASKRTLSRRDLAKHDQFEQVSPEVGELDESAVDDAMDDDPDAMLALLADLTGATDPKLRDLAKRLAGRLFLDLAKRGPIRPRGIGKMATLPYRPDAGDIDLDASMSAVVESRAARSAIDPEELKVRTWVRPGTAIALCVDRSGSMGGEPLATSAVATAAVAWRSPEDYSVITFGKDVVVVKSQESSKGSELVVNDVLALRGFGTTDLAGALRTANEQLSRSRAGRRIAVVLSDCRATVEGDVVAAARGLDEVVIIAPAEDDLEARALAAQIGARVAIVAGPSDVPAALQSVLGD
ncbi:MAG: VWA domain-containing protein [Actinomycetota bacterium]|nr:VWA domain-containing protein [Actinomycetota bacterium]MDA2970734.1 VWA domain-containing protein [Actinomycetota bacterium]MDA3000654.1 VWA domain-containing protein [Actinomycetota bacterium]